MHALRETCLDLSVLMCTLGPLDNHLIHLIFTQSAIVLLYSLSPYTCYTHLQFLVDQLPKLGPCYSLCIWQVTGSPPNHGSVAFSCIL